MVEQSATVQQRASTQSLKGAYLTTIFLESKYEDSIKSSEDVFESYLGSDSNHSSQNSIHEDVDSTCTSSQSSFSFANYKDPNTFNSKRP